MKPISDFDKILQDGYRFQYQEAGYDLQEATITTHHIGDLVLTSGTIVPCDPLIIPDSRYYLKKTLPPGKYPVIVSVARFQPSGETRIAAAMLRISDEPAVRWEVAQINEPDEKATEDRLYYGVDAGTGCFLDLEAADLIANLVSLEIRYPQQDEFELFCDRVNADMDKNAFGKPLITAGWTNMRVGDDSEANMIAFSSGWGDGGYASFWGYDASGNLTSLVTDFALFANNEAR